MEWVLVMLLIGNLALTWAVLGRVRVREPAADVGAVEALPELAGDDDGRELRDPWSAPRCLRAPRPARELAPTSDEEAVLAALREVEQLCQVAHLATFGEAGRALRIGALADLGADGVALKILVVGERMPAGATTAQISAAIGEALVNALAPQGAA